MKNEFSIPVSEHSVVTLSEFDEEIRFFVNMVDQFLKDTITVVSDSWNSYDPEKLNLSHTGTLVVRVEQK